MTTAIGLPGKSYLQVKIGDTFLPLTMVSLGSLLVSEHHLYHGPMGQLDFFDTYDIVPKAINLSDGLPVEITVGTSSQTARSFTMRIFNVSKKPRTNGVNYSVSLIHDLDEWRLQPATQQQTGTSCNVLRTIAQQVGFKSFKGSETTDKQTWFPNAEPWGKFAGRIARRGYASNNSCMLLGVTLDKGMRYVDIGALNYDQQLPHFTHGSDTGIVVLSWRHANKSGYRNEQSGYNRTTHQFDPATGEMVSYDKVNIRRTSRTVNQNLKVKGKVGQGNVQFAPLDAGNGHANWARAEHQNMRVQDMLSQSVSLIVPIQTSCTLFDPIRFSNYISGRYSADAKPDPATSGTYIVAGKTLFMAQSLTYVERIHIFREGYNTDTSKQVS